MLINEVEKKVDEELKAAALSRAGMDKLTIGFFADILYIKGLIYFEEFDDIMEASNPSDLQDIIEKMLRGEYNAKRRGEGYVIE